MKIKKIYRFFRYQMLERHICGITARYRVLPNFIIIGAKRCGTTSLYYHLGMHPCIMRAKRDNVGFFNNNFQLGLNYYKSFFPTILSKNKIISKEKYFMTFDVTTTYVLSSITAKNIFDIMPKIKLILIVRNPIDRAYSEYNLTAKEIGISFEEIISSEMNKIYAEDKTIQKGKIINKFSDNVSHLLRKGMYAQQLEPWLKLFSKDQFLIISTEDYALKTQETYNEIFKFLGLPQHIIKNSERINQGTYIPMKTQTRNLLVNYFRQHNDDFFKLIGKKFDWDK